MGSQIPCVGIWTVCTVRLYGTVLVHLLPYCRDLAQIGSVSRHSRPVKKGGNDIQLSFLMRSVPRFKANVGSEYYTKFNEFDVDGLIRPLFSENNIKLNIPLILFLQFSI